MCADATLFLLNHIARFLRVHREAAGSPFQAATALMLGASRALAFALLLGMAAPLAAQSTKFIPTFIIYYGGGPKLTPADAAKFAKFDLIDIDRYRYQNIPPNTWAAIKAINPSAEIYLYQMGPEVHNKQDSWAQVSLNTLGRYDVSRGHPMGSLNGSAPGLFQLNSAGNRIYSTIYSNPAAGAFNLLMDFGSSAYQYYWVSSVKADIIDQPWRADGIFADACLTLQEDGSYSAPTAWYSNPYHWSDEMNSFVRAIANGLHQYGQKLWCNKGGTRSPIGFNAWRELDNSVVPPDVLLEEGAFAVKWGFHTQFFAEDVWKRQVDLLASMRNVKAAMLSHTQLQPDQSGWDNWGRPVTFWQTLWYAMGSFLLGKNDNSYFGFTGGSTYNRVWWFDEYDRIDLGRALGPYTVRQVGGVNVYSREFERGYVYVNPTATDVPVLTLPRPGRELLHHRVLFPVTAIGISNWIELRGHNAVIVLKA